MHGLHPVPRDYIEQRIKYLAIDLGITEIFHQEVLINYFDYIMRIMLKPTVCPSGTA